MLLRVTLLLCCLTAISFSTPLHKTRHHSKYVHRASPKRVTSRSPSFHNLDRHAALAAQAATLRKFRNAPALLASHGTSPTYTIPPSLQDAYNRASDYATDIAFLHSQPKLPPGAPSSAVRVAAVTRANTNKTIIIPLTDETDGVDDFEYFGSLGFGSPAQKLPMDFDTGSADVWVPVGCNDCDLPSFQANVSRTYLNTGQPFAVEYGSGEVNGTLAKETVSIGPIEVPDQYIGAVESVSENLAGSPNAGIVGMAFGTIANSHQSTLFENLIPHLTAPLFSVFMTRTQVSGAEICFGCVDASKAREKNISWVPVAIKTWWTVRMRSVSVNNTDVPTRNVITIVDTGTSFIYCPAAVATAIYALIPQSAPAPDYGDGYYAYPCDTPVAVSFMLGPQTLALDPRDMSLGRYPDDPTGSTCIGAIVGSSISFVILGDSFLKSYVSVYDYSHGARIGFVKSVNE